ncbi:MAG: hypothetical protein ACRD01_13995 [Terriglobales bacterium]
MIADIEGWRKWEAAHSAAEPVDYERNLRWFDAALAHARALGAWPPADPLEGFEANLAYIHRLHASLGAAKP